MILPADSDPFGLVLTDLLQRSGRRVDWHVARLVQDGPRYAAIVDKDAP